jgi:hypothetical protein
MSKHCIAGIFVLSVTIPGAAFAGPDHVNTAIAPVPDNIQAEARWSRAERDRANEILARDLIAAKRSGRRERVDAESLDRVNSPSRPKR